MMNTFKCMFGHCCVQHLNDFRWFEKNNTLREQFLPKQLSYFFVFFSNLIDNHRHTDFVSRISPLRVGQIRCCVVAWMNGNYKIVTAREMNDIILFVFCKHIVFALFEQRSNTPDTGHKRINSKIVVDAYCEWIDLYFIRSKWTQSATMRTMCDVMCHRNHLLCILSACVC